MRRIPAILVAILAVVACRPGAPVVREPALGAAPPLFAYRAPPPGRDAATTALGAVAPRIAAALHPRDRDRTGDAPPLRLTPTDGTELVLRELAADIALRGPLAHTELHATFHNPEPRVREGRFTVAVPVDAAVSRFAMKVDGAWREARIVSRTQGRAVYESFLHRRADPALLERDDDQGFSARVFPIGPGADKEIIIAYDHEVGPGLPYVLPLRGLPAVPITVAITQDGVAQQRSFQDAAEDVVLDAAPGSAAIISGAAFVARIDAPGDAGPAALDRVLVLVDTSASRAAVMARQADAVRRLIDALPAGAAVAIAVYDHAVREVYRGPARRARGAADAVIEHGALGASDLAAALHHAAIAGMPRVVVIGDAVATLGERDPARLAAIVARSAIERVDVIQLGPAIDRDAAHAIVGAARSPGAILDGRDLARATHQLARAVAPARPLSVAGAIEVWPATTRDVAPGDPIFVHGLYRGAAPDTLAIAVGDRVVEVAAQHGDPVRVRRAVASAQLATLGEAVAASTDPAATAQLRAEIDQIALAHGLVSAQTSLLTLESDADEQRMLGPAPGEPTSVTASGETALTDEELARLAAQEARTEVITVTGSLIGISEGEFRAGALSDGSPSWGEASPGVPTITRDRGCHGERPPPLEPPRPVAPRGPYAAPYAGALGEVMAAIARDDPDAALDIALRARLAAPDDIAAILALGEALEARGATGLAARAYGSLIDLFPNRDELVRAAGERLDRLGGPARELAVDAYRRALAERPDRVVSRRRLAYALVRLERFTEAFDALAEALPAIARPSVADIVRADLGLIAAAAIAAEPSQAEALGARLAALGVVPATTPSLRFVLHWETDANDVDLHVRDRRGDEAYYAHRELASGGRLLDDLTDGFGPEMLAIDWPDAFPYRIAAHYFRRGPEGLGLGAIQVIRHDGHGGLTIEDRPFALQLDDAMIDLGIVTR